MKKASASCPSCGSLVEFTPGASLVSVCPSCATLVARTDRKLSDHGKVAAIVRTETPIHLHLAGRFRNHPFTVMGHVQFQHASGGMWDEWYVLFPGNRWAVIAEAQGKRYITRSRKITSHMKIPAWDELSVGMAAKLVGTSIAEGSSTTFVVQEFGTATLVAAEGELPFAPMANSPHRFADLTGPSKGFATVVYEEMRSPMLFLGQEVSLFDLGISSVGAEQDPAKEFEPTIKQGLSLSCPNCGGTLELRAPDRTLRITCPFCASLLDVEGTNLIYLKTLFLHVKPLIPLGTEGTIGGTTYTVIGFMQRAVEFDSEYVWDEYLLYEPTVGFRWLVQSDLHWSFVEPAGEVKGKGKRVWCEGEGFQLFQRAWARVVHVYGEFYWKVTVGDIVLAQDYIAPPKMLTIEMTPTGKIPRGQVGSDGWMSHQYSESVASIGTYMTHEEVERAFRLQPLMRGAAVAPNQPAPKYTSIFVAWPFFIVAMIAVDVYYSMFAKRPVSHVWTFLAILFLSLYPLALMLVLRAFEMSRWADSEFNPYQSNS